MLHILRFFFFYSTDSLFHLLSVFTIVSQLCKCGPFWHNGLWSPPFRAPRLSIYQPRLWRNNHGGFTPSTWCGSRDTRSPRLSQMSLNRSGPPVHVLLCCSKLSFLYDCFCALLPGHLHLLWLWEMGPEEEGGLYLWVQVPGRPRPAVTDRRNAKGQTKCAAVDIPRLNFKLWIEIVMCSRNPLLKWRLVSV